MVDPRYDLTGNQLITSADVAALSNVWFAAQEHATCAVDGFSSADLNGDGCVDIADIADMQLTAAQMGNATTLQAPQVRVPAAAATNTSFSCRDDSRTISIGFYVVYV